MRIIAFVEPPFRFEPPGEFALLTQMSPSDRFIVVNEREVFFGSNFCLPPPARPSDHPPLPPPFSNLLNSSARSLTDAIEVEIFETGIISFLDISSEPMNVFDAFFISFDSIFRDL